MKVILKTLSKRYINIFFFNYFHTDSRGPEESNTETDDINHDSESNDSLEDQLKRIKEKVEEIRPRFDTFTNGFTLLFL